jgi:hypothetical protein
LLWNRQRWNGDGGTVRADRCLCCEIAYAEECTGNSVCYLTLVVAGAVQNVDRVRQQVRNRFQRFHRTLWTTGQVDDQRRVAHGGNRSRQNRMGRFLQTLTAHFLGNAWNHAFRFRRW